MIGYLTQLLVFQALFLAIYELFLKKETFFSMNRAYLLATPFLAAIIPLLEFEILQNVVPMEGIVQLPVLIISEGNTMADVSPGAIEGFYLLDFLKTNWLLLGYLLGVFLSLVLFLHKYIQLQGLKYSAKLEKHGKTTIVRVPKSRIACTFFNTIFLGENLSETETSQILLHELAHVEHKHSWDLLLFEFLRIFLWFDPFVYRYQSQLSTLHEYIADEKVTQNSEKKAYSQDLLNATFGTRHISFTNQFFKESLIKKRIMMLQKPKSNRNAKLKYLLVLPLLFTMLTYVACSQEQNSEEVVNSEIVKTIEVETLKAIDEKMENEIINEIQKIGKKYEKVIVVDSKNDISLVFTKNNWNEGFITQTEKGLNFRSDKMIIESFENSDKPGPFEVVAPNGVNLNFSEGVKLLPPPPPGPPSPFNDNDVIPFSAIDKAPVFPGCDNLPSSEAAKACMTKKIAQFVNDNFDKGLAKRLGLKGALRIQVLFKISQTGEVVDVKARAPQPELEKEAVRVVSMLPEMIPGEQDGKKVSVLYSLPIIFKVQ